jgi:hypothetical protein
MTTSGATFYALSKTYVGYQENFSLLMTAGFSNKQITIVTTGNIACGLTEVGRMITSFP